MDLFLSRRRSSDLDAVINYLPDTVIDRLIERKRAKREEAAADAAAAAAFGAPQQAAKQAAQQPALSEDEDLNFEELVALAQPSDLALDSYSARGLLNAAPRSAAVLSSLKLAQDRFLQRYSVVSASGEEIVLTFDMQLEECLQPKYRGLQVVKRWFLKGITGEPAYPGDVPRKPEPCWGPEAVCHAQLEALQAGDAAGVFRFASPANQAATGPTPLYRPLLQHEHADLLRSVQMRPDTALLIVGVRSNLPTEEPGVTQRVVYSWTVRLQGEEAGPEFANCWMTEAVQPISQNLFGSGL
ncbi:hypothetical protein COHA_006308 [Chlorella ohadii]|uniref:DUF4864 domain-containing n=1 Tax=Chlorella ohadii TaxID=2649997 RepID=A0AAD5DL30_9CHLO|nr:hypothetical protein COHA_006308 [Chlorella ohadii]